MKLVKIERESLHIFMSSYQSFSDASVCISRCRSSWLMLSLLQSLRFFIYYDNSACAKGPMLSRAR